MSTFEVLAVYLEGDSVIEVIETHYVEHVVLAEVDEAA